jgi:hypothetical protein
MMDTEPPLAEDVGLRLPAGIHWYFRKLPLAMGTGAADFTVSFLGGILAADLNTCLQLTMSRAGQLRRTVGQHLDGSPCAG